MFCHSFTLTPVFGSTLICSDSFRDPLIFTTRSTARQQGKRNPQKSKKGLNIVDGGSSIHFDPIGLP